MRADQAKTRTTDLRRPGGSPIELKPTSPRRRTRGPTRVERENCVEWPRRRCPGCDSEHHRRYGGVADQGDGTELVYRECLECSLRFKVILFD
jgi:hypothetical protein